jgi:SAM-dependent methyltransferase
VRFLFLLLFAASAHAVEEPYVGQPGKDVVWVPTPEALVEKMLDMARVTPADYVIDLGSGDGRNVIAAARRGAQALGVEFDPGLVALARRNAAAAGVGDRARFIEGDMYEADISQATVLALFLLPENLQVLKPKFLALRPGTRIVVNGYEIPGWVPHETGSSEGDCGSWCIAYLYVIPGPD